MIYLDSAAMAPVLPIAMNAYHGAPFGNPSSEHAVGHKAREYLEDARKVIAARLYAEPEEVFFTATATEASAIVMNSLARSHIEVVPSNFEHHAISENVSKENFYKIGTAIAQMHSNNEVGFILESPKKELGTAYICDATSSVGHIPVSFQQIGCDFLIADAIKFGGVPGAAFLISKKTNSLLSSIIRGGGQERGLRSGTENVPAICAMAAALEWQVEHMAENTQHLATLRQMMFQMLSKIPDHQWNTPFDVACVPHILNISFNGVDAHALTLLLSKNGIMVSPGAACSNGLNEPSHVIMAMYHDEARARSAIRISFSHENTIDEAVEAGQKIKEAVAYLRSIA